MVILQKNKLRFLQVLRGFAALSVVGWHASGSLGPFGEGYWGGVFAAGSKFGVHLFFIISGFIMVHVTQNNPGSVKYFFSFLAKRLIRIVPLYYLAIIAVLVLHTEYFTSSIFYSWLAHSLLFIPMEPVGSGVLVGPKFFGMPIVSVGWTLNYEMYFYLLFALFLFFRKYRFYLMSFYVIATVIIFKPNYWGGYMQIVSSPLVLYFYVGSILSVMYGSRSLGQLLKPYIVKIGLFVSFILIMLFWVNYFNFGGSEISWIYTLAPFVFFLSFAEKLSLIKFPRYLLYLGDISFSLYLFHPLILEYFAYPLAKLGLNVMTTGGWGFLIGIIASIFLSAVIFEYLEKPITKILRTLFFGDSDGRSNSNRRMNKAG